jgi:hypothetical protein
MVFFTGFSFSPTLASNILLEFAIIMVDPSELLMSSFSSTPPSHCTPAGSLFGNAGLSSGRE